MLSERERRVLASIEAQLIETDPDLVRLFREGPQRSAGPGLARTLLTIGLAMLVFGTLVAAHVALLGIALSLVALGVAHVSPHGFERGKPV